MLKFIKKITPFRIKTTIKITIKYLKQLKNHILLFGVYKKYKRFTMIPAHIFIGNISLCKLFSNIKGSVVECGVWRGGTIAAIADLLGTERHYYLFDSFEGLPPAEEIDGQEAINWQEDKDSDLYFDNCKAEMKYAEEAMKLSGVKNYKITKGWFNETLPGFKTEKPIAILRLDGDWYDSTMQCLDNLYHQVVSGGIIIIDDYYVWEGSSKAVHDFLSKNKLSDTIHQSEDGICYIIKK